MKFGVLMRRILISVVSTCLRAFDLQSKVHDLNEVSRETLHEPYSHHLQHQSAPRPGNICDYLKPTFLTEARIGFCIAPPAPNTPLPLNTTTIDRRPSVHTSPTLLQCRASADNSCQLLVQSTLISQLHPNAQPGTSSQSTSTPQST
jgi:hypothetical protein